MIRNRIDFSGMEAIQPSDRIDDGKARRMKEVRECNTHRGTPEHRARIEELRKRSEREADLWTE